MKRIKKVIKSIPLLESLVIHARLYFHKKSYINSSRNYWVERYGSGGNSGPGSYDKFAEFKGEVLNDFIIKNNISKVVELGCGDGNQLKFFTFPEYVGYDVSPDALNLCRDRFGEDNTKTFKLIDEFKEENADLTLSLDVIYHLIEDNTFTEYMDRLFIASRKYVIIYSSNSAKLNLHTAPHVKHRKFTNWVKANKPDFKLHKVIPNKYPYSGNYLEGSFADFYIFEKK